MGVVHVVVPAGVDDPARPSGGNVYDRQVCAGLVDLGHPVHQHRVEGSWPRPDRESLRQLAAALSGVPDGAVVLVDGLVASGAGAVLVPLADRLRLVTLLHLPIGDDAERAVLAACAAVVTTSRWTRRVVVERHGLDAALVQVAEPGAAPAEPAAGGDGGALLSVGALTPTKGQDVLVSALTAVRDLPWRTVCAGSDQVDPAFAGRLRSAVTHAGVADRVRFVGPRTGPELDALYASADLVVVASRAESYGMVVTEALAHALPVVATDVGGVPEALGAAPDGQRPGLLVPPDDPAALAEALRWWLVDATRRDRLRRVARERRQLLPGWEQTCRQVARVLETVAAR